MNDLEDRLRTTLHERAGTVSPSPDARADLERLLAERHVARRRVPVVVAAAAAVVAAVAIPLGLSQHEEPRRVATAPPPTVSSTSTTPRPGDILAGPIELGPIGDARNAVLTVKLDEQGRETWCLDDKGTKETAGDCAVILGWPGGPPPGSLVLTRGVFSDGQVAKLMLFVTTPQATTLEVTNGAGQAVSVRQLAATAGARYYLADFGGPSAGFGYTAKDAAGNVLVSAIT